MTEREAIASLKTLCNTCTMFPKCVNNKPECFQAIEKAISALKKQEQDRWIPVTEALPEKPGWYAITVHYEAIPEDEDGPEIPEKWATGAAYWDWVYPNDPTKKEWGKRWVNVYDYDGYLTSDDCITAWRPLPEPYTEEES